MNKATRLLTAWTPLLVFLTVLFFLWRSLSMQPDILPSTLIGKPTPSFRLHNIMPPSLPFTEQSFKGHVTLLNVWATWCYACVMEHPMLMEIQEKYHVAIYGIDYKDDPQTAKDFLATEGNPYTIVGNDDTGDVAMDFGVYGTPETFVIDKNGKIVYRHIGAIDKHAWEEELLPLIQSL